MNASHNLDAILCVDTAAVANVGVAIGTLALAVVTVLMAVRPTVVVRVRHVFDPEDNGPNHAWLEVENGSSIDLTSVRLALLPSGVGVAPLEGIRRPASRPTSRQDDRRVLDLGPMRVGEVVLVVGDLTRAWSSALIAPARFNIVVQGTWWPIPRRTWRLASQTEIRQPPYAEGV